jgi:hypothetical protein
MKENQFERGSGWVCSIHFFVHKKTASTKDLFKCEQSKRMKIIIAQLQLRNVLTLPFKKPFEVSFLQ